MGEGEGESERKSRKEQVEVIAWDWAVAEAQSKGAMHSVVGSSREKAMANECVQWQPEFCDIS